MSDETAGCVIEGNDPESFKRIPEQHRKDAALVTLAGNMLRAAGLHAVVVAVRVGDKQAPVHTGIYVDYDDPDLGNLEKETSLVLNLGTQIHKSWFRHLAEIATAEDSTDPTTPEKE